MTDASRPHARVREAPLDADAIERAVLTRSDGALVTFRGVVRDHDGGRGVESLEYRAHPDAERLLAEVCRRIESELGAAVAAEHRTGLLRIGDTALVASVAAPHRAEAFSVCSRLVDEIKRSVPIWKRQRFEDGTSEWVGL